MQRKIQFNLIHENNECRLAVTEIIREENFDGDIDPVLRFFFSQVSSVFDYIDSHIEHFNALDRNKRIGSGDYLISDRLSERITDRLHRNSQFIFRFFSFRLPTTVEELLPFLGSLDGGIHTMIYHNKGTFVEYLYGTPQHNDLSTFCQAAFTKQTACIDINKQPLSREIAQWMCATLQDNQHELVTLLNQFLLLESRSLTPAIRQFLYPRKTHEMLIAEHCKDAGALICDLLNPGIPYIKKDKELVTFIRNKLSNITKPDAENPKNKETVHREISDWFNTFKTKYQKTMWEAKISTIAGLLAFDGGFYSNNYTEVQLLQQANIVFNDRGLAELKFTHTLSYRRNYAEGERLHDILDKELSQICHDLDLHFLPNQNFHVSAIFDEDSSRALRNAGFHITENYCKELMRNERLMQMFRFSAQSGDWHDMHSLNQHKPLQQMILNWANLFERKENLWKKAQPTPTEARGVALQGPTIF